MSPVYEPLHTVEYREYKFRSSCSAAEAGRQVVMSLPQGWQVRYIETTAKGIVFKVESPLPDRIQ